MIEIVTRLPPYPEEGPVAVAGYVARGELKVDFPEWLAPEFSEFLRNRCFAFNPEERATFKVPQQHISDNFFLFRNFDFEFFRFPFFFFPNVGNCRFWR